MRYKTINSSNIIMKPLNIAHFATPNTRLCPFDNIAVEAEITKGLTIKIVADSIKVRFPNSPRLGTRTIFVIVKKISNPATMVASI
jgi:hypothetical protein